MRIGARGGLREGTDQTVPRSRHVAAATGLRAKRARDEQRRGTIGGAKSRAARSKRADRRGAGRDPRNRGQWRRPLRGAAQGGRRRIHLLQSLDRRPSDLRCAGRRARDSSDQGHSGRRRGGHGRRLCPRIGAYRRRRCCQYRSTQRDDPDGQQLEGPDSAVGRGCLGRSGRAGSRPIPGDRSPRVHDGAHHQMVLAGAVGGGHCGNNATRPQICVDPAVRAGVPGAAGQYARAACQGADLGAQQIRRADANSSRQGRYREGRTHAHRGEQSAGERRRRDHHVPRRKGAGRTRRAARLAGRRRGRPGLGAGLLVETFPDPSPALHRHAGADHALSGQA